MTTVFKDPEIINDAVVGLFVADGSWKKVFDYMPAAEDILGYTSVLIVLQRGVLQTSEGLNKNPTRFRFLAFSMVRANNSNTDGISSAESEARRRQLDQTYRQIIRDNMSGISGAVDDLQFGGESQVDDRISGGLPYIVDSFEFFARLHAGS